MSNSNEYIIYEFNKICWPFDPLNDLVTFFKGPALNQEYILLLTRLAQPGIWHLSAPLSLVQEGVLLQNNTNKNIYNIILNNEFWSTTNSL